MLNIEEEKICKEIFKITDLIKEKYMMLFFDEITNDYLSQENREEVIENLKKLTIQEKELYKKLEINVEKADDIYEAVNAEYYEKAYSMPLALDTVFNCKSFDRLRSERIKNKVYTKCIQSDKILGQLIGLIDLSAVPIQRIIEAINNDFERAFLYFNEKDIKKESVKDNFSRLKYQLIFISENAEGYYLNNNDKDYMYFSYPSVANFYNIPENIVFKYLVNEETKLTSKSLNTLICSNNEIENAQCQTADDMKMFHSYLRASLAIILNTPFYNEQIELLENELEELEELSQGAASMSVDNIIDTTKSMDDEKCKCKYLTFKIQK